MEYGLDDTLGFGKYKDKTIADLLQDADGFQYLVWLQGNWKDQDDDRAFDIEVCHFIVEIGKLGGPKKILKNKDTIPFGKHKGRKVSELTSDEDINYLEWLRENTKYDFEDIVLERIKSHKELINELQSEMEAIPDKSDLY